MHLGWICFSRTFALCGLILAQPICKYNNWFRKVVRNTSQPNSINFNVVAKLAWLILAISVLIVGGEVEGAFFDIGEGARPQGMGRVFVGVADDANALFYNTAGITQIERMSGVSTYTKLYVGIPGLNEGALGVVIPLGSIGYAGVSGTHLNLSDSTAASYAETTVGLSYAYKMNDIEMLGRIMKNQIISLGIKVKGYNVRYGSNAWTNANPIFGSNSDRISKWGYGGDASIYYKSSIEGLRAGISIENIGSPDIGLENESRISNLIRVGGSYNLLGMILTSVEVDMRGKAEDNGWIKYQVGSEYWAIKEISVDKHLEYLPSHIS